jgi:tetratricopeptide (TPR) repeat protein
MQELIRGMTATGRQNILVLGAPAIGKTSLALHAANSPEAVSRFGARRYLVRLDQEGATDVAAVQRSIARSTGRTGVDAQWLQTSTELARTPALLILDNLETCWELSPTTTESFLRDLSRIPELAICVTLRGAERPSGVGWDRVIEVTPLPPDAAKSLFERISGSADDAGANLKTLLNEMGGIPLAIELLAERAQYTPLRQLEEEWRLVKTRMLRRPGRPSTKLSSVDISLELSVRSPRLGRPAKRLFRMLGQLPAGFRDTSLRALLGRSAFDAAADLRRTRLAFTQEDRLVFLPPVREFAAQKRLSKFEARTLSGHVLQLVLEHGPRVGAEDTAKGVRVLLEEGGNLEAVLRLLLSAQLLDLLSEDHVRRIADFQRFAGTGSAEVFKEVSEAAVAAGRPTIAAHAMLRSGEISLHKSQYQRAIEAFSTAGQLFCVLGERVSEATCIKCSADVLFELGRFEEAGTRYCHALRRYRRRGSHLGEGNCWSKLADSAMKQSRMTIASKAVRKALRCYEEAGDGLGLANCALSLAEIALEETRIEAAHAGFADAESRYSSLGDLEGLGRTSLGLASIAAHFQDGTAQKKYLDRAAELFDDLQNPYWIGEVNFRLLQVCPVGERQRYIEQTSAAWRSIGRTDLIEKLNDLPL